MAAEDAMERALRALIDAGPAEDAMERALRALIDVGRTLLGSTDQTVMLDEVCRILVENIGYSLAWVGELDPKGGVTVVPVASYGVTGYLDGLHVTVDSTTPWGRGPTGTAIRTGEVQVVVDADQDQRYRPWAERAARYGILSACALPVPLPEGGRGSLNLYAPERDRFTEGPLEFLKEVAAGIGASLARIHDTLRFARSLKATVESLSTAVETRDLFTAGHQARVAALSRAIAEAMGLGVHDVEGVTLAAEVHDIGKLAVPVEILTTPNLLKVEYELIKTHSMRGYEILDGIDFPWPIATWVRQHHERLDGSGYPDGLKGDDILPGTRILSVADVVESMASYRPYRPTEGVPAALEEVQTNAGRLYDSAVVEACVEVVRRGWDQFLARPQTHGLFIPRH